MPKQQTMNVQKTMSDAGYVLAGGMWGDAYWKQLGDAFVVAIGADLGGDGGAAADYTNAPENDVDPCQVWVYRAPFLPNWTPAWGEGPADPASPDWESRISLHPRLTLAEALAFVAGLAAAQ